MASVDLLTICIAAFVAVFVLLAGLALLMRLTLVLFPQKEVTSDAAVMAALATVMQAVYPGTKISRVEERK